MKQWIALLLVVSMVSLAIPVALADDNGSTDNSSNQTDAEIAAQATTSATEGLGATPTLYNNNDDTETQNEIAAMNNTHGATMRLLQLQRELEARVLYANAVISLLNNKTNATTTDLQADVTQLSALIDQVKQAEANTDVNASVQVFLDIKSAAMSVIADFRVKAASQLTADDRKALQASFAAIDKTQLTDLDSQIKTERQAFNADRVSTLLQTIGQNSLDLAAKVKSGEVSAQDAVQQIKQDFSQLKANDRARIGMQLAEQNTKQNVMRADMMARLQAGALQRRGKLDEDIAGVLAAHGFENASARIDMRGKMLEERSDNITQNWSNMTQNWTNWTGHMPGRGILPPIRGGMGMHEDANASAEAGQ